MSQEHEDGASESPDGPAEQSRSQEPPEDPPEEPPEGKDHSAGFGCLGVAVFVMVNLLLFFVMLSAALGGENAVVPIMAGFLALATFGGGGAMCWYGGRNEKGFGIGLMIGWGLMTIFSAGLCTGVNPEFYNW